MKKRIILPIIIAANLAISPLTQASETEMKKEKINLSQLLEATKEATKLTVFAIKTAAKAFKLEGIAEGLDEYVTAFDLMLKEAGKKEPNIKVLIEQATIMNKATFGMTDDLKKLVGPVIKLLAPLFKLMKVKDAQKKLELISEKVAEAANLLSKFNDVIIKIISGEKEKAEELLGKSEIPEKTITPYKVEKEKGADTREIVIEEL